MKQFSCSFFGLLLYTLLAAALVSCGSPVKFEGTYVARGGESFPEMVIDLNEGGRGEWKKGSEKFSFNWSTKGDELRIHLKEGGVLVGDRTAEGFKVALPGAEMNFERSKGP
jgi:hypothetical protein